MSFASKLKTNSSGFVIPQLGMATLEPVLDKMVEIAEAPPIVPAVESGAMSFLRKAIDAPTIAEVKEMIQKEITDFSCLSKIELKIGEEVKIVEGGPKHYLFPEILTAVNCKIPVALVGPAGSGKSTLCEQVASALSKKFYLQNSVSGSHELTGYMDAYGKYNTTSFREAFTKGGIMMVDEVDTSDAGALKWLNTALANGYAMFPDMPDPVHRHEDFRILIAANTFGNGADRLYVGANQLDASTLDRFVFFDFKYDEKLEAIVAGNLNWVRRVQRLRAAAFAEKARMVISPRASINGSKLLAAGWKQSDVEDRIIWKDLDPELRKRIVKKAGGG